MTRDEMLERAWRLLLDAEVDGDMEARYIALADAWLQLAAEVRKGSASVSSQVD
jgi:hypothetical protein